MSQSPNWCFVGGREKEIVAMRSGIISHCSGIEMKKRKQTHVRLLKKLPKFIDSKRVKYVYRRLKFFKDIS